MQASKTTVKVLLFWFTHNKACLLPPPSREALQLKVVNMKVQAGMERWPLSKAIQEYVHCVQEYVH